MASPIAKLTIVHRLIPTAIKVVPLKALSRFFSLGNYVSLYLYVYIHQFIHTLIGAKRFIANHDLHLELCCWTCRQSYSGKCLQLH